MATFFNRATLTYGANSITSNTVSGEIVQTLSVTKTALSEEYIPGSTVTYVIALRNSGITTLSGLTLTDDLGRFTNAGGVEITPLTFNEGSLLYDRHDHRSSDARRNNRPRGRLFLHRLQRNGKLAGSA